MPPNGKYENYSPATKEDSSEKSYPTQCALWNYKIIPLRVLIFGYFHIAAIYGMYLSISSARWFTLMFAYTLFVAGVLGATAGAHRLWSHRTYKAKLPLQILLAVFHSISSQWSVINWARDHRLHHRHSDTDADPHNSRRGFFFSHIGWLLVCKHPEVLERGKSTDLTDLMDNPVLRFQHKYLAQIMYLGFTLPVATAMYFWGESFNNAWHVNVLRFVLTLNVMSLINSAAHMWGYKPYDKSCKPTQNIVVTLGAFGEGFHNYHHTFPCDYRAAELGDNYLNLSTRLIDVFAWLGWAYDLKAVPEDVVRSRAERTGDGTHAPTSTAALPVY